jgi:hypothetical protein
MTKKTKKHEHQDADDGYRGLLEGVRQAFSAAVGGGYGHLFTTNAKGLFEAYLAGLPARKRQHYNCNACRSFVKKYGGLVAIDERGRQTPIMWNEAGAPKMFRASFKKMRETVARAKVTGVFLSSDHIWGTPTTGPWHHMSVLAPTERIFKHTVNSAGQVMAEKRQEHAMLLRALLDFSPETVKAAIKLVESKALYRGEKIEERLCWLADLIADRRNTKSQKARDNVTWLAVAKAPAGYAHVRSSVIGSLLDDLRQGKTFVEVMRAFDAKMNPLQYMRPQAPPSLGNIAQANVIVERLRSAGAFERRYARIGEVNTFWHPRIDWIQAGPNVIPGPTLTWEKFSRTVLYGADRIEYRTPVHGRFIALTTAVRESAPPIFQWDLPHRRNPVSWYVYADKTSPRQWGLPELTWVTVTGITLLPSMWHGGFDHHGAGAVLLLKDCRDLTGGQGLAMFPEMLKGEYHGVRATIEAHSRLGRLRDLQHATACGVDLRAGQVWEPHELRVFSGGVATTYKIDRWD